MRRLLILAVLLIPSATLTFGQDCCTRDTLRLETSGDWIIMSRADTMYSVEVWAWCDNYNVMGISIPLRLKMEGPYYIPERFDSFIVIDTLIKDPNWDPVIFVFRRSVVMNDVGYPSCNTDTTFGYNGTLFVGVVFRPPIFNIGDLTKIGDLILKIRRPWLLPIEFTIEIDSMFYLPAGGFKFSPAGSAGYTPYFQKVSIYVNTWLVPSPPPCGDVDENWSLNIEDAIFLVNYIFGGESAPLPWLQGDVDCSGAIDLDDVVYLIYFLYGDGPQPCDPNGDDIGDCR